MRYILFLYAAFFLYSSETAWHEWQAAQLMAEVAMAHGRYQEALTHEHNAVYAKRNFKLLFMHEQDYTRRQTLPAYWREKQ